jgi:N-acetylmuramoyl-L-alanine amidase
MIAFTFPRHWQVRASPNHNPRPNNIMPSAIVLHADAANRVDESLDWCRRRESKVSYHILIGRTGNVFSLVHPELRAWHCGVSEMDGVKDVNDFAIGVCLSNRNNGETYPTAQVFEGVRTCALLCRFYGIDPDRITTHALIALPAGRKTDPVGLDLDAFKTQVRHMLRGGTPPLR